MTDQDDWDDGVDSQEQGSPETSKLCVAALVLGILSPVCCGILTGIPAIICGHMGMGVAGKEPDNLKGRGMAIAGLVLGYLSILMTISLFLLGGMDAIQEAIQEAQNQQ